MDYQEFLKAKQKMIVDSGKEVDDTEKELGIKVYFQR